MFVPERAPYDQMLKAIGNKLLKKAIDMLLNFNPDAEDDESLELFDSEDEEQEGEGESRKAKRIDKFNKFWKNYGKNIKLGMVEDGHNKDKLAQLTRWYTNRNASELISFDEYIARMKHGQKHIYFLGGDNRETLQHSHLSKS
jgi:heat shock protein beta